jgi:hypothetical protein
MVDVAARSGDRLDGGRVRHGEKAARIYNRHLLGAPAAPVDDMFELPQNQPQMSTRDRT